MMPGTKRQIGETTGFTLLEMSIAMVVMAVVFLTLGLTSQKATDAIEEKTRAEEVTGRLHRSLDRIIDPLAELERNDLPPLEAGTSEFQYHLPTGYEAGIQWDVDQELALEYDPAELADGIDNDGDGLIDECQIVRTRDPGGANELRVVICKDVAEYLEGEIPNGFDDNGNDLDDERGFVVDVQGDVLTIRLTIERRTEQGLVQRTATSSVRIRN